MEKLLEYGIPGFVVVVLLIIVAAVIRPMVKSWTEELKASREERKQILLPMIETVAKLSASVTNMEQRNSEAHAATLEVLHGLKTAVDILCSKANGGK